MHLASITTEDKQERLVRPKLETPSIKTPPQVLEKPSNVIIMEKETGFIEAVVTGNPFPSVVWVKHETRECHDGVKYKNEVNKETGVVGLTILKARSDDEAKYTLQIVNELGEDSATCSVFVKCNF
jgi:hypothetical protein